MEILKKIVTNSAFAITIFVVGVGITVVNLYITSKLAPVYTNINEIIGRVNAVEQNQVNISKNDENIQLLEIKLAEQTAKLEAIDARTGRIEDKIDIILQQ